jgi:hypothetical protein
MPKLIDVDPVARPIECKRCGALVPPENVYVSNPRPNRRRYSIYRLCTLCIREDARRRDRANRSPARSYITKHEKLALAAKGLRRCSACKAEKPFADFSGQTDKVDGLAARCRVCAFAAALGVPAEDYARARNRYDSCQVCGSHSHLCVDHDHDSPMHDAVRGVLCRDCNRAIGRLGDSLDTVSAALRYVRRWLRKKPSAMAAWARSQENRHRYSKRKSIGQKRAATLLSDGKKHCARCQRVKDTTHFDRKPSQPCGFNNWCKPCTRATYEGIDPVDYAKAKEIKACQICGAKDKPLHIDHDHDFPRDAPVRGVLCSGCNTGIGMLGESIERLKKAVSYLRRWHRRKKAPRQSGRRRASSASRRAIDKERKR